MKPAKLLFAALLLTGSLGTMNSAIAADSDEYIEKAPLGLGDFCHEKFPTIDEQRLGTNNPTLRNDHDVIDYYGPCDELPTGKDQLQEQQLEQEHRFENNYEDYCCAV